MAPLVYTVRRTTAQPQDFSSASTPNIQRASVNRSSLLPIIVIFLIFLAACLWDRTVWALITGGYGDHFLSCPDPARFPVRLKNLIAWVKNASLDISTAVPAALHDKFRVDGNHIVFPLPCKAGDDQEVQTAPQGDPNPSPMDLADDPSGV